ncbi:MAG TPA: penicillin-binding protein 1C [Saprospiraceae bacterium]|nr:penicillin-binding protein 1C [Saprospiraceae bacterium]HRK81530.1 penicillin-binding protein 1C [Saprospiraceae bacterium]
MKTAINISGRFFRQKIADFPKAVQLFASRFFTFSLRHKKWLFPLYGLFLLWLFCLPSPLFQDPVSVVLEDRSGELLGAKIAADGQWRFPALDTLSSERYEKALIEFEDKRFYRHPGVDVLAFGRALRQNISGGRIVSGGSTITMQVIRMARKNKPRSLFNKLTEAFMATRLELGKSKRSILALYASHAPFGGNVVGLDAASWRYFGKSPELLSWAEAATLAVLPNSPALIHPGRNRNALMEKRNRLLDRLFQRGIIDETSCRLAKEEPLPDKPHPLPREAPHLLDRACAQYARPKSPGPARVHSTLRAELQKQVNEIAIRRHSILTANGIHNMAILVLDVSKGEVLAYLGNVPDAGAEHGEQVDIVTAPRSSGSILKPLLYTLALQEGRILPGSLLSDVPVQLRDFKPENFGKQYEGVIPARRALSRSLNVPFVHLLQDYGVERFHFALNKLQFSTITKPPTHYGLSLILGGAETTLWDVTNCYASMARMLEHFPEYNSRYNASDFRHCTWLLAPSDNHSSGRLRREPTHLNAGAAWLALEAMRQLERPSEEGDWESFGSGRPVAWKTGTSFGFRDAWAVGVTPHYAVGVWVGNADGEGRPGLIGVQAAAPVLFDVFQLLRTGRWFYPPYDEMIRLPVCAQSGYQPLSICPRDSVWAPRSAVNTPACPYHETIHLDAGKKWRVHADCESPTAIVHQPWFVLPPLEEFFYIAKHADYQPLPPLRPDCEVKDARLPMQLIYPRRAARIYVPVNLDGSVTGTVFTVAHRNASKKIYWHLDEEFLGTTENYHNMTLQPAPGTHQLTLVDEDGYRLVQTFEIVAGKKR